MGFLKSIAKSLGGAKSAALDAAGSLFDAVSGRNDAPSQPPPPADQPAPRSGQAEQAGQDVGQVAASSFGGNDPAAQAGQDTGQVAAATFGGGNSAAAQAGQDVGATAGAMQLGGPTAQAGDAGSSTGAVAGAALSKQKPAGSPVAPCPTKAAAATPGILSTAAQDRANDKFDGLSAPDKSLFTDTINNAGSDHERAYIWKAFAACHTPRECATFAARIRNRSPEWMQDNLSLTGDSQGRGVKQQWSHSCNATTVQAVRGQMDPIYALDTHQANPNWRKVNAADATKHNPKLAEEQRRMLTSTYSGPVTDDHAGVAAGRGEAGGSGRWADDLFNQHSEETGVRYVTRMDPPNPVTDIDNGLKTGAPVPIVIGNGTGEYTHYVLVTSMAPGPPKRYTIHDPWSGRTVSRSERDMKNGNLRLAGSNQVTAIEVPVPIVKPAGRPPC